ncbi:hypothetical protein E8E12_003222 [Didymella heteroderae]|uniref:Uncharacterized protein n=1 Tax=Didymella heteroderae TaxID=1769908 RepID=A0A9P4WTB3_9PLEO|nr:hypothetical protein E8E12_003222 [Didymella heteroderae]
MAIQWKEPGAKDRLLAAVIAASPNLSMKEVARLFGQGATYDAIEGQLRKAKNAAAVLKEEAAGRSVPAKTPSRKMKTKNAKDNLSKTRELLNFPPTAMPTERLSSCQGCSCVQEDSMLFDAAINGVGSDEVEDEV